MIFSKIIGNELTKKSLEKALLSKFLPNTLLFYGPSGVGKYLFAKQLAKKLMYGENSFFLEKRIDDGNHPDFHLIKPDGKLHSIQTLRQMIDEVHKPPFEAKSKVFVIDDADKMLASSSNIILKTLEEPDDDSYLILITSNIDKILLTVRSRCMLVSFSPIKNEIIQKYLVEKCDKSQTMARYICRLSQGSLGMAIMLAKHPKFEEGIELLFDILSQKKGVSDLQNLEEFCKEEFIFSLILMWFRDLNIRQFDPNNSHLFFAEAQSVKMDYIPSMEIVHHALQKAKKGIERNIKETVCLENFLNEVFQTSPALS